MNIQNYLQCFIERLQIQRYSPTSIKNYQSNLLLFLTVAAHKYSTAKEIEIAAIEKYIHWKIKKDNISASHQRIILASITKFYELVLEKRINLKHLYPQRKEYKLPNYLSTTEIKKLIEVTDNLKHKSIIMVLYSGGLRLSEVVNLKITDIDSKAMTITIRQAKGKKDRQVMLSENFLLILRQYYLKFKPNFYLFEGQNSLQYSARSIQQIVKQITLKSGINKTVSPHVIRHSFATHLIEAGTDIRYIQKLLGHNHVKTTQIYTQITDVAKNKIKSPLDRL
ncbi:tyrosine-type recombinase/integrase [Flavobacterium sp.]|uniref:tyrosine-type recombinase/integrase n=1 Tax=Flavobacterium sp. TaxID=239 RepID=UPI0035ADD1A3